MISIGNPGSRGGVPSRRREKRSRENRLADQAALAGKNADTPAGAVSGFLAAQPFLIWTTLVSVLYNVGPKELLEKRGISARSLAVSRLLFLIFFKSYPHLTNLGGNTTWKGSLFPISMKSPRRDRRRLNGHGSLILWFTGLPSSGKSTLANEIEKELIQRNHRTYILDGDNVRMGLCKDLGFSAEDREGEHKENRGGVKAFHGRGSPCPLSLRLPLPAPTATP